MAATRTQIYLTQDQRRRLDRMGELRGASLAELIREAVDGYLDHEQPDRDEIYRQTFGAAPDVSRAPDEEWDARQSRIWSERPDPR